MNKALSTLVEISNIIRNILKRKLKMKLVLNFNGDGTFTHSTELGHEATTKVFNFDGEE